MNELGFAVKQTTDGGYIITGSSVAFAVPFPKIYLIKTDSLGNSGCNQVNDFILVNATATQVSNPPTFVTSPSMSVTNAVITDSSGGFITTVCISIGINEITKNNYFLISPNPSPGNFEIKFSEIMDKGTIEIYSVLGKRIFSENIFNESKKEINLKNISSGIYFVKVFDGEKSYCGKIVVEHN